MGLNKHRHRLVLGVGLVAACGPGSVATTDDPATSTSSGPADTDSATGNLPTSTATATPTSSDGTTPGQPDTTSGPTGGPDPTLTTTATTAGTENPDPSTTAVATTIADSSTGEPACPEDTVLCIDDALVVCDGMGGFKPAPPDNACTFGCADESECNTCEQAIAAKDCPAGLPRVMILLDASSSMLDPPDPNRWDQARGALAGDMSMFDLVFAMQPFSIQALVGLTVFGNSAPSEARQLVQYGACHQPNIAWALDPASSCVAPGCVDPDAVPPIKWTSQDGSLIDPPGFADKTLSHMPKCDFSAQMPMACIGSKSFLHLGLDQVSSNIADYKVTCKQDPLPCTAQTEFLNILIIDGKYDSTDNEVKPLLQAMFTGGVTTHVIGLGPDVDMTQLAKLADWGSGTQLTAKLAADEAQLKTRLEAILGTIEFC